MKPSTALADPYPAPTVIPKFTLKDDCCDYESELVIVIGKKCKDVSEADALSYVLGYTAANDVSSRAAQFAQSQWSYSKGFDGACPIGMSLLGVRLQLIGFRACSCFNAVGTRSSEAQTERIEEWESDATLRLRVRANYPVSPTRSANTDQRSHFLCPQDRFLPLTRHNPSPWHHHLDRNSCWCWLRI